jgi:LuxR family transcriptional regulator, quorum-sensing system regulator BjaR1
MLSEIIAEARAGFPAQTPQQASLAFFEALRDLGASYLQTRLYRRPVPLLTSATHWEAGGVITRIAPENWVGSAAFNYVCFECNPLLAAIREGRTRYCFSDFAPHGDPRFDAYWAAMREARIGDAICATSYGPGGMIASVHLGFEYPDFDPEEILVIQMAGLVLTERLMGFADVEPDAAPALTGRERDSLALVADGKTDWEISVILGISECTARFHVDNARRKLGAVNRAQAVARLLHQRLI